LSPNLGHVVNSHLAHFFLENPSEKTCHRSGDKVLLQAAAPAVNR
jgi:hypothetical protein